MAIDIMRYFIQIKISHVYRYHEIFYQDQNISCLQISWDISSRSKYLMVKNIMRYLIKIKISHNYRYQEIFHLDQNISWLLTSWDISSKYIMVIDQFNPSNKTVVNRFRLAHHRTALRDFFIVFHCFSLFSILFVSFHNFSSFSSFFHRFSSHFTVFQSWFGSSPWEDWGD